MKNKSRLAISLRLQLESQRFDREALIFLDDRKADRKAFVGAATIGTQWNA